MKDFCLATIITQYDITHLESQRFMEKLEVKVKEILGNNIMMGSRAGSLVVEDYVHGNANRHTSMNSSVDDDLSDLGKITALHIND